MGMGSWHVVVVVKILFLFLLHGTIQTKGHVLTITTIRDDELNAGTDRFLLNHLKEKRGREPRKQKRDFDIMVHHDLERDQTIREVILELPFDEKVRRSFRITPTSESLPDNYFVGSDNEGQSAQFCFDLKEQRKGRDNGKGRKNYLVITGTIQLKDETTYLVSTRRNGSYWVKTILPGDVPQEEDVEHNQGHEVGPHNLDIVATDKGLTTVDVLIVYTMNAMVSTKIEQEATD